MYGLNRHRPPPFWQINHANSAYFRLFLGYISQPPPFTYPGSAPVLSYVQNYPNKSMQMNYQSYWFAFFVCILIG